MQLVCYKCLKEICQEESFYGLHKLCFEKWFCKPEVKEFSELVLRTQSQKPTSSRQSKVSFFNGAYRKYSARLGTTEFILKVQQKEYPELPATEFLCNQIYHSLGITVPNHFLIRFPDDQPCFVTQNFMSGLVQVDFVHIYRFLKSDENYNCETLLHLMDKETTRKNEKEKFVYLTLADSLIGNHDRHGRNLGFIRSPQGIFLAPFYDNPSAIALEDPAMLAADLQPKGAISTQKNERPSMQDYVHEWRRLGYGHVVDQFRSNFSLEQMTTLIAKSPISEKRQAALLRLITSRAEELCAH